MYCPVCGIENPDTARYCSSCGRDQLKTTPITAVRPSQDELTETGLVRGALESEYEIIEELGRGGMAIVFRANERQLEREVAIKVLPFSLAFDKEFIERFQREARTAAKLEHPNIIPIYRVGKAGRVIFFVMKLLRGESLAEVLGKRGQIPPAEARSIMGQTLSALAYANQHNIVHRDIKPDNIMFDELGHVVLTDFGIAKAATGSKLTGTGMSIGTPHYMSPEQARAQSLDGRSDIYSLGIVAYQMLTGQVPFDADDAFSIGYKHITEPLPVPELPTAEHQAMFDVVARMTAKNPDDRYQSASDLLHELEVDGIQSATFHTVATPPSAATRPVQVAPDTPTTPLPARQQPERPSAETASKKEKRSVATVLAFVAVVLIGTAGGGGWWLYTNGLLFPSADTAAMRSDSLMRDSLNSLLLAGSDSATVDTATIDSALLTLGDSTAQDRAAVDPAPPEPAPPPIPALGTLVLEGIPDRATVFIDGETVMGRRFRLTPGNHALRVVAQGFAEFAGVVPVAEGATHSFRLPPLGPAELPCSEFVVVSYNRNSRCFDARPNPRMAPVAPIPDGSQGTPSQAIIAAYVSAEGTTIDVRVVQPSGDDLFTQAALDFVRQLEWNPAQKNSRPVAAWTQVPVRPATR